MKDKNRRLLELDSVTYNPETEQPILASHNLDTPMEIKCNSDISSSYSQYKPTAIIRLFCKCASCQKEREK
jgi:hypothetical protein